MKAQYRLAPQVLGMFSSFQPQTFSNILACKPRRARSYLGAEVGRGESNCAYKRDDARDVSRAVRMLGSLAAMVRGDEASTKTSVNGEFGLKQEARSCLRGYAVQSGRRSFIWIEPWARRPGSISRGKWYLNFPADRGLEGPKEPHFSPTLETKQAAGKEGAWARPS